MLEDHFRTLFNDFSAKKENLHQAIRDSANIKPIMIMYEKSELALLLFLEKMPKKF